jgi:hypothetical protein
VRLIERRPGDGEPRRVEEAEIEAGVVGHEHAAGREIDEARQHCVDARLLGEHRVGDAGQSGDERRQPPAGVHELREAIDHSPAGDLQRADLDDAVPARRRAARRLQVDDHPRRRVERLRQRRVRRRDPAIGRGAEREARIGTEQRL